MQLPVLTFTTLVQRASAAVQGACGTLLDLSVGSVLRATLESTSGLMLWLQWLCLLVLSLTRASTSNGADLDTWMADFALTRLAGIPATGAVTFSRASASSVAVVSPGTAVRTSDLTQTCLVTIDTTNATWNAAQDAYVLPIAQVAMTLPVANTAAGSAGNVQAGAIALLGSAVPGIDYVTNALAFTNGLDAESDAALRARFQAYINSRSLATALAVKSAVAGVQQGLTFCIQENINPAGQVAIGTFTVAVDDGSGMPSSTLLATVADAVDAVRPIGSVFYVVAPSDLLANVNMILTVAPTAEKVLVIPLVATVVTAFIDSLSVGAAMPYSRLAALAYAASPLVSNVAGITLNGGTSDIGGGPTQVVRPGTIAVS